MKAALLLLLLLAFGCDAGSGARGPGVILISLDTLRADRLGSYGYERPTSPALDRFAAEGVLFERAIAPSPWTMPSHASLFTGLQPARHGVQKLDSRLDDGVETLAERLQQAGFETAAFVNSPYLSPKTGLGRGFTHYREFDKVDRKARKQVLSAGPAIDEISVWLDDHGDRPFFVFFHTYDVHSDYQPGPRYRERFARPYQGRFNGTSAMLRNVLFGRLEASAADIAHASDLYDGAVRQLDDQLARLFAYLDESGLAETTTVIVVSDHGEEFLEHGGVMHGYTLFGEMLRVPLLVRGPGIPSGARVPEVVQLTDVAPTVLSLLGLPPLAGIDGHDLTRTWSQATAAKPTRTLAYAESVPRPYLPDVENHLVAVRGERFKLIHDFTTHHSRLYDIANDPRETRDVAAEHPEVVAELLGHAEAYRRGSDQAGGGVEFSDDEIEQLRALGYVE